LEPDREEYQGRVVSGERRKSNRHILLERGEKKENTKRGNNCKCVQYWDEKRLKKKEKK